MASKMEALVAYRPRILYAKTVNIDELVEYIARGTTLNTGEIRNMLAEFNEAISYHCRQGMAVNIEGLGVFRPSLRLDGEVMVNLRMDRKILKEVNKEGAFTGEVVNRANIGLTQNDLIALWNADHPDDPVEDVQGVREEIIP
ncbi:MAG: hypothetical protein PVI78_07340 [Anaerolineales bacterium]|jgi:nucleoid DNA-binding protein